MKKKKIITLALVIAVTATLAVMNLTKTLLHSPEKTHLPLYEEITAIKNRLTVNITEKISLIPFAFAISMSYEKKTAKTIFKQPLTIGCSNMDSKKRKTLKLLWKYTMSLTAQTALSLKLQETAGTN